MALIVSLEILQASSIAGYNLQLYFKYASHEEYF